MLLTGGLRPWCGLWPNKLGQSPNQGHSPKKICPLTAGDSLRLTSGGKTESDKTPDFWLSLSRVISSPSFPALKVLGYCQASAIAD